MNDGTLMWQDCRYFIIMYGARAYPPTEYIDETCSSELGAKCKSQWWYIGVTESNTLKHYFTKRLIRATSGRGSPA
eukprot:5300886-Amphidinium_carterae.1